MGAINARSPQDAVAKVRRIRRNDSRRTEGGIATGPGFFNVPPRLRGLFAIIALTWKAAFRYRLFWVIVALLLGAVVGLPLLIKDDGTAAGIRPDFAHLHAGRGDRRCWACARCGWRAARWRGTWRNARSRWWW